MKNITPRLQEEIRKGSSDPQGAEPPIKEWWLEGSSPTEARPGRTDSRWLMREEGSFSYSRLDPDTGRRTPRDSATKGFPKATQRRPRTSTPASNPWDPLSHTNGPTWPPDSSQPHQTFYWLWEVRTQHKVTNSSG